MTWLRARVVPSGAGAGVSPVLGRLAASALAARGAPALAFGLMVVPTTAMGATLPLLVRAAVARSNFGAVLGRLYGWNTLGAVFGAPIGEVALIEWWGIRGAALGAAGGKRPGRRDRPRRRFETGARPPEAGARRHPPRPAAAGGF